jgi:hypothetical protein
MLGILLSLAFAVFVVSGWAVVLAMLGFGGFVWLQYSSHQPELMVIWLGNLILLAWKYGEELGQPPGIRPWLMPRMGRRP